MDNNFNTSSSSCQIMLVWPGEAPRTITPQTPIYILCLQPACSATSQHFHLPPHYESHEVTINISLNTANLNVVIISSPELWIWQHLEVHWNRTSLQHLANIHSVPLDKLYKQMFTSNRSVNLFLSTDESTGETVSVWTLFSHAGVYVTAIGSLIPVGLGTFCCYFLCCQPAILVHQPLQLGSTCYTVVDDNVEAAPIYKCDGKAVQPIVRCLKNHGLHIEWEPTQMESQQKQ